ERLPLGRTVTALHPTLGLPDDGVVWLFGQFALPILLCHDPAFLLRRVLLGRQSVDPEFIA
ncbi:MAG: hypothetical protein L0G83_07450, partial [Brevibacterium aurantiacum]|nr:hypothetical protein [Brevibacterium aurantiacum]